MDGFLPAGLASLGASAAAAALALALVRLRMPSSWAVAIGGRAPAGAILGYYFYLESQAPVGPYYAVIGLLYGLPALLFGLGSAAAAVLVRRQMRTSPDLGEGGKG